MNRLGSKPLRTSIVREGQPYVDEPVYETVSKATPLAMNIAHRLPHELAAAKQHVFGGPAKEAEAVENNPFLEYAKGLGRVAPPKPIAKITALSHYNHVRLRWMKPDGKGGLVPRSTK